MTCIDYEDMIGAYALDALASPDKEALEAHLPTCATCRAELSALREVVGVLAYGAPPAAPPPELKGRLMARIRQESPAAAPASIHPISAHRQPMWRAASAVLGVGMLAALAWGVSLQGRLTEAQSRLARVEQQLASRSQQLEVLKARDVQMTALAGQAPVQDAVARFIWSDERRSWLVAINGLAPTEAGKTYQLWALTESAKHSLGTFQTGPDGEVVIEGAAGVPPQSIAAAVSVEPSGGVPQPTGPIVMVGSLPR